MGMGAHNLASVNVAILTLVGFIALLLPLLALIKGSRPCFCSVYVFGWKEHILYASIL